MNENLQDLMNFTSLTLYSKESLSRYDMNDVTAYASSRRCYAPNDTKIYRTILQER